MENKATRHELVADTPLVYDAMAGVGTDRGRQGDIRTKEKSKGKTKRWSIFIVLFGIGRTK